MEFRLTSQFKPMGDQPQAIEKLVSGLNQGEQDQVLLGVGCSALRRVFTVLSRK
jgi:excinuclease ABC subunit B